MIDDAKIIAAIRDMAAKCVETRLEPIESVEFYQYRTMAETPKTRTVDAYSKEWIAGRLTGLADALEALTGNPTIPHKGEVR